VPGCIIRERTYDRNEEVIYVIDGKGFARIDEVDIPIEDQSPHLRVVFHAGRS
jgi:hypothetical protein